MISLKGDRAMKKRFFIVGLFIFIIAIASIIADENTIPPEKEKIIFNSSKVNPVTFAHSTHMALKDVGCGSCHGCLDSKEQKFTCSGCHEMNNVKVSREDTFHKFCIVCHKKEEYKDKKAPVDCAGCHKIADDGKTKS